MKLNHTIAIVTGGSHGIGKAIAEAFVREGATVIILSREAQGKGAGRGMACDVSDAKSVLLAVKEVVKRYRRIDILVNCAGIQAPIGPFEKNNIEAWKKNVAVNLFGTMHACHAVLPFMIKQRSGSIINIAGGGATSSRPNFSAYAVAKTGVVKLTEVLADEVALYHVRVNAMSPGAVNTAMLTEILASGVRAGKAELLAGKKRLKEGGISPEVPAELAVFLASKDSEGLTGRLISAPWDDWKKWDKKAIKKIMATEKFKLRRVV